MSSNCMCVWRRAPHFGSAYLRLQGLHHAQQASIRAGRAAPWSAVHGCERAVIHAALIFFSSAIFPLSPSIQPAFWCQPGGGLQTRNILLSCAPPCHHGPIVFACAFSCFFLVFLQQQHWLEHCLWPCLLVPCFVPDIWEVTFCGLRGGNVPLNSVQRCT
jgi:hypothetical protein